MKKVDVRLDGVSVLVAMPVHRDISPLTVHCLLETQAIAMKAEIPFTILFERGCAMVDAARSACVHRFLQTDRTKLLFIDSDMQWDTDTFLRIVGLSSKMKVICGSYPAKLEPLTFLLNVPNGAKTNEYGCVQCESGGLGFSIIDREIVEKLYNKAPRCQIRGMEGEVMRHVFRTGVEHESLVGEDVMFFNDIRKEGYEVWCDPSLKLGHIGSKVYRGSLYEHTLSERNKAA